MSKKVKNMILNSRICTQEHPTSLKKVKNLILNSRICTQEHPTSLKTHNFGHILGRHGSPRAHTLAKRSHGLQEGF